MNNCDFSTDTNSNEWLKYQSLLANDTERIKFAMEGEVWWNQSGYHNIPMDKAKKMLDNDYIKKSNIVDMGSGKGQALISFAINWEFKLVKGVEYNKEYNKICLKNISNFPEIINKFKIIECLAENYVFEDKDNFIFMFNPFGPKTLQKVMINIINSLKNDRKIYILYYNPRHGNIITETNRFILQDKVTNTLYIYTNK